MHAAHVEQARIGRYREGLAETARKSARTSVPQPDVRAGPQLAEPFPQTARRAENLSTARIGRQRSSGRAASFGNQRDKSAVSREMGRRRETRNGGPSPRRPHTPRADSAPILKGERVAQPRLAERAHLLPPLGVVEQRRDALGHRQRVAGLDVKRRLVRRHAAPRSTHRPRSATRRTCIRAPCSSCCGRTSRFFVSGSIATSAEDRIRHSISSLTTPVKVHKSATPISAA